MPVKYALSLVMLSFAISVQAQETKPQQPAVGTVATPPASIPAPGQSTLPQDDPFSDAARAAGLPAAKLETFPDNKKPVVLPPSTQIVLPTAPLPAGAAKPVQAPPVNAVAAPASTPAAPTTAAPVTAKTTETESPTPLPPAEPTLVKATPASVTTLPASAAQPPAETTAAQPSSDRAPAKIPTAEPVVATEPAQQSPRAPIKTEPDVATTPVADPVPVAQPAMPTNLPVATGISNPPQDVPAATESDPNPIASPATAPSVPAEARTSPQTRAPIASPESPSSVPTEDQTPVGAPNTPTPVAAVPAVTNDGLAQTGASGPPIAITQGTFTPAAANSCSNVPLPRCDGLPAPAPTAIGLLAKRDRKSDLKREGIRIDHLYEMPVSTWNFIAAGTLIHTNPAPGVCQCFNLYGVALGVDRTLTRHWDVALRANYGRAGNALYEQNFAMATFEAGPKYNVVTPRRDSYFAEALVGVVKPTSNFVANNALALSATVAVGMNYSINKHWAVRVFEGGIDYTTEPNGGSNSQFNIRASAGVVYKLGKY